MTILERGGWTRRKFRQIRRKAKAESGVQLFLDICSYLATAVQVVFPAWLAYRRNKQSSLTDAPLFSIDGPIWIYCYVAIVIFALVYKNFLSKLFKPERLQVEIDRRPLRLASALAKLTSALETGMMTMDTIQQIERQMLEAITSEVGAKTGDTVGVYLNASLIVPDPDDNGRVKCINRSNTHRDFPKVYHKDGMITWTVISTGKPIYEPDFKPKSNEPYRSILCFPLMYQADDEDRRSLGCVSIDHQNRFEFDDLQKPLEVSLSPYLRILELALVYRNRLQSPIVRTVRRLR